MLDTALYDDIQLLARDAWKELLSESGTNGYLVTLGFRQYLDLGRAIDVAENFLLRVNRRLFGKRFKKHGRFLKGMIVLERKGRSTRSLLSPHFHIVVSLRSFTNKVVNEDHLRGILEQVAHRLRLPTGDPLRPFGQCISGHGFVDVRKITSSEALADYLTKDCYKFGPRGNALNIGFLGIDGIEGLADC